MSDIKENFKYQKSKKNRFELHDYEITFDEKITHEEADRRLMEAFRGVGIIGHCGQIG